MVFKHVVIRYASDGRFYGNTSIIYPLAKLPHIVGQSNIPNALNYLFLAN